ncbi:MAG: hypothetical protein A2729_01655 [Candidatus Buchananbacteria bacterium RIFCSPHIGHO2_01_FULL_39_14]|uniref:Glycosyltransferase RgtA/B/C/D-like domain-containing protein n=2 Tax=Candidatus Buchananiibacteriota TaxID=1817903 RepID=A0A1G1YP14_9BACT|nr:MAG: hypothetical protein A2729_01655 [Candidatus Buchananbacteria bacterium RIFCSPHIGHO2_01_FULL_39_14]OGY48809.1 MAG: hypothetical protein A3D39_03325 [Candidatus Buchananbacteria bacterium RIFCSPHIGHO2_02_FULL_39_17]OGY54095.1 MAG: hypothetical protein A2912_01850 [Candidatus Buchananbacteria bacterium RIFCSPLOWO2_01_FULL_40_23b]
MKELINSVTRREWQFVALMSVLMIILTGLPYLIGYFMAPAGTGYNGLDSLTPGDNPIYYSYINQVKNGSVLVKDLFTAEFQETAMFNIFWFLVGNLAKIFNWSVIFSFHFIRLFLTPVFVVAVYIFFTLFFRESKERKLALIFLLFSAGVGAYFIAPFSLLDFSGQPGFGTPNDIWVPESITFLSLYKTPHFIASLILMILIFLLMLLAFEKKQFRYSFGAGILAAIYFNFHPFYIPLIFGTLFFYLTILIFKAKKILWFEVSHFLLLILLSLPSIYYHFWLIATSEVIRQRALQNITLAPNFIFILIGYGFLWPLAAWGMIYLFKKRKFNHYYLFLACLLLVAILLIILPNQFQSRYLQGIHLPLVIFAVVGLYSFKDTAKFKFLNNNFLLFFLFILFFAISNLFNLTRDLYYFIIQPEAVKNYFYLSEDLVFALKKLNELPAGSLVLSDVNTSLFIPGFSQQPVFVAHGIETIDYGVKRLYADWFFAADNNSEKRLTFLKKQGIDYLFFNQGIKKTGFFNPADKNYLKFVYQNRDAQIYQVLKVN